MIGRAPRFLGRASFTLIELLVVIAIIAILSVVVVLTLNPSQLLAQSRDGTRLSDMASLNTSLSSFITDQSSGFIGTSSVVYVSVPDTTSTCSDLGLPGLPSGWSYNCVGTSTLRNVNGTGWIPASLTSMSTGAPLAQLPVDPVNSTSSNLYYTYTANNSRYDLKAVMEAAKDKYGGSSDKTSGDGGMDPSAYEVGSNLALNPAVTLPITSGLSVWLAASNISGLSDGSGIATWTDASGNGNTVTQPTGGFQPIYKANILNGWPIARFLIASQSRMTKSGFSISGSSATVFVVATVNTGAASYSILSTKDQDDYWDFSGAGYFGVFTNGRINTYPSVMPSSGTHIFDVVAGNPYQVFDNGVSLGTASSYTFDTGSDLQIGYQTVNSKLFTGDIAEILIYNYAMGTSDRQAIEKYLDAKYKIY